MRIKKAAEAKHEATKSPATAEFLHKALDGSLLDLLHILRNFSRPWSEPRGDLYHWIPLLNAFDLVLAEFNSTYVLKQGPQIQPLASKLLRSGVQDQDLQINLRGLGSDAQLEASDRDEDLVVEILNFSRLLLDNCANRTLYNSSDHIEPLLNSTSTAVLISALHLASRCAATYYRSNYNRASPRQGLNSALLQIHYRINPEHIQKLAEPFATHFERDTELVLGVPQTPSRKSKEVGAPPGQRIQKQTPKLHPSDLCALVQEDEKSSSHLGRLGSVRFEVSAGLDKSTGQTVLGESEQSSPVPPTTPTPTRRTSGPSRLSQNAISDEAGDSEASTENDGTFGGLRRRTLVISAQEVESTDINTLLRTYLPRLPTEELGFAFLTRIRYAKGMLGNAASRQACVAIRILALENVAFLYPENAFSQKIIQSDSQLPRELQLVSQLTELAKPGEKRAPDEMRVLALEALEAISTKHKAKHNEICSALGVTVNHGIIFQLLREINQDLQSDGDLDMLTLEKHDRIFNLLDSLRSHSISPISRSNRSLTLDALISAGLLVILVETLTIRSAKAQHAQNRTIVFVQEGSRQTRDGIRTFANASGLGALSDLISWEVNTCLDAVTLGKGISLKIKSKVMDYSVPVWHQQTLRTALKFVNYLLSQQTIHTERLLRNLIDSAHLLRAMKQIIANAEIFGSNIYANTISMVSTFIHNEPQSYSVIQESGISKGLLDSISSPRNDDASSPSSVRRLPVKRSPENDKVLCGQDGDLETVVLSRSADEKLAPNILCSTDVLLNLPHSFGALCLTSQGLQLFLSSRALESYFEVFESAPHVRTIASEKDLATFIGNAFDELVRHHPDLRTAVLRCFILTLARLVHKCRTMEPADNARIRRDKAVDETQHAGVSATTVQDVSMSDTSDGPDALNTVFEDHAENAGVTAYITIFCRFLNGFFANQQMAASFLDNGGLLFALDLCTLPSLPFDFVHDPGFDASYDLTKTIHTLSEARPSQTIPVVLTHAQQALDSSLLLIDSGRCPAFLQTLLSDGPFDESFATELARSFLQTFVFLNVLQELLSHSVFQQHARDRSWSPLSTVNATEMWISVISKAGVLSKFCTWQALSLFDDVPSTLELLTRLKGTGIGAEANKILGISTYPPVIQVTAPDKDHFQVAVPDSNGKFEPSVRFRRTWVMNCKIIRHMFTTMPNTVSAFFLNVGSKAVTPKKPRDYVRQNMFMLSEAVSRAMIEHLEYDVARNAQKPAHLKAYYIVVLDIIRRILYVNDIDGGTASHFTTIFFLTLRNNGLIQWLSDLLLDASRTVVSNSEEVEKISKPKETQSDIVNSARVVMRLTLVLLSCFVSNKFYTESSQSSLLASLSNDAPNHTLNQFTFSPGLTLVEVRWSILQAIEPVWSIDGVENLASQPLRRILRIMRAILEAEGEPNKTYRRKTDIPTLQEATHRQLSIVGAKLSQMTSESKSAGNKWDHNLIIEALYRSNNDLETAREYAEARISLSYPRFPPPSYDLDLTSAKIVESPSRRDSQLTAPEQGTESNPQLRLTDDITHVISDFITSSAELHNQGTSSAANTATTDVISSNEADDDRRMAMSIDNVLTITERERSQSEKPADTVTKSHGSSSVSTLDQPKPPIKVTAPSLRIAVEDLDVMRNPMRKTLITRVMDILSVHDTLTVDLSELLKTAAKTKDHDQAIQIKKDMGDNIVDVLLSYGLSGETAESKKNIATCANLLARLMQDRDFYKACSDRLANIETIDALLGFVKVFPDASQKGPEDGYPWIGHVLLVFEKLLSEELRPEQITWQAPVSDSAQKPAEPIAGYVDQILDDDQRHGLFDSLVAVLPHIGRDRTLALSTVRVLAMLTRHPKIASKLSAKHNLQRLFLMIKQMAGLNIEALQTSFMLILRHISEDEDTIRRTMRNAIIESFVGYRGGDHSTHDTATYVRNHSASILRAPKVFLEVTDEILEITKFDRDARSQVLALKKDAVPKTYSTWDSSGQQHKPSGSEDKSITAMELIHTTEAGEATSAATEKLRAEVRPPVVERPDGLVHFLLSQLLSYRTVEDNEATDKPLAEQPNSGQMDTSSGNDHDTETAAASQTSRSQRGATTSKLDKREEWKPEDHPIHHFRVFLLQCLTELLMSYNQAKVEFINFSRKADPKATTPSKPRSGVLNYLLNDLIPLNSLTRETNIVALKKQGTSTWAMSVVVALCLRTPETYRDGRDPTMEARDGDLLFVRRFIIEHAIKAYRDIQSVNDLLPEVKYARMLSISDLFNRMMMGRVLPLHSSAAKQHGETEQRTEMHKTYIARIMYEKNLIGVLTASCAEIDLAVPNAKRAVKYILRPLKSLTFTAIEYSKESDISTAPSQTTEEDEIATATSVSDISDVREETPDLARYSALGILEPSRGEDRESEESEDEDEEMYDDGYDEGMEYEDDIDHADDDEAVSDPDEDDEMGPIEGVNGDMIMNIEVVNSDGEEISEDDEDESDDDESDDEGDDDSDDDEDMDDDDGEVVYEEIEAGDGGSLDDNSDSHEHEWREIDDVENGEDDEEGEDIDIEGGFPGLRGITDGEHLGDDPFQAVLAGEAANFASLADDIENGRYMANMELVRNEDDEQLEVEDEEGDDLDDEEAEEEDDFMYETYDDDDDGPGWDMDEEFNIITGRTGRHHSHHHHGIEVHGGLRGAPFGRLELSDLPFMTREGGPPAGIFPGHSAVRVHRNGSSGVSRGAADDGINPLLARTSEDQIGDNSWRHAAGVRTFHRGNGMPSFLEAIIGTPGDRGAAGIVGGLMSAALPDLISRHGNWSTGGNIVFNAPISPEDMELLMGGGLDPRGTRFDPSTGTFTQRSFANSRDDAAYVPPFTPLPTDARWQEEAKMLFPHHSNLLEQANTVTNSILRLLVPDAMEREKVRLEKERVQKEAERREEEEKRKRREQEEKDKKEREDKERQEREQREREEDERRQREAAEALVQSVPAATSEEMEIDQIDQIDQNQNANTGQPGNGLGNPDNVSAGQGDRVFTRIRDRLVDITELGIAADYIEALPEDMREEVVMGRVQEQRSQAVDAGQAPTELSQEFLNALPEDIREDIIQQDRSDRMRRERQEARRREQEVSGAAQAEDMNLGDFLATLDEDLRRTVLLEENFGSDTISQLPPDIRRQAERIMNVFGTRHREPAPSHRYGYMGRAESALNPWDNNPAVAQARAKERRPIVQMLDKQGIHTVLRLLFVPQQGSLKESLNTIFENLAQNRQNRAELISLLLALLQEGSSDSSAIERSYTSLSYKAKQKDAVQMTPKQLKRTLTGAGSTASSMSSEVTSTMVLTQCLAALGHLSQFNPSVQGFFVNEHETSSTLKRKGKGKEKERENKAQKYAINALLSLLDKQMIMDNAGCMEHLSSLLQHVTHPLLILLRKEKEEKEREAKEKKGKDEKTGEDAGIVSAPETADQPQPTRTSLEPTSSETDDQNGNERSNAEQPSGDNGNKEKKDEGKKQRNLTPPVIPEQNLRLVINIITAKECNGKIFRDTIGIITNLSAVPGAKDIFGKELVKQAQELGTILAFDLTELLDQLRRDSQSTSVQTHVLSKFSIMSSEQTKLLRVLTALDYLFDTKRNTSSGASEAPDFSALKSDLLNSLYDSPTFGPVWERLSDCLKAIRGKDNMTNVATILLPLIEALMVVCKNTSLKDSSGTLGKSQQFSVASPEPESSMETLFFRFTEDHRKILNDLVRNNPRLMSGTFALLVRNPKVLEFDNKRNYFTRRLQSRDETRRSHPSLQFNVRRKEVFTDSYRSLYYKSPDEFKYGKLNVKFSGEEGVDAGGVTREWFQSISRQMFDPGYALFVPVASDRTTFHPDKRSSINPDHLSYFKFIGRIIGKAMFEGRPLDCHFSRAVYKRILGKPVSIKDMETLDLDYYKSLLWMLGNDITEVITETFSLEEEEFGVMRIIDLKPNGRNVPVTEENKHEFVQKVVEFRLTGSIQEQLNEFLVGFHQIVPANLVSIFNEQELELLISGLPEIDIDDWKANTEYHNYNQGSAQIQWFWRAVRSFDKEERAKLMQFVTGTSKVPLNGFKELEGMNGFSKFNIHRDYGDKERLPSSHTCFNQLDLPEYDDYETLRARLYTAMTAGGEYFGFA